MKHWVSGTCCVDIQLSKAKSVDTCRQVDVGDVAAELIWVCGDMQERCKGG